MNFRITLNLVVLMIRNPIYARNYTAAGQLTSVLSKDMATIAWQEDIFSDSYLDAFYRAHIAPRRGNLDDDIAAIEAEIRK